MRRKKLALLFAEELKKHNIKSDFSKDIKICSLLKERISFVSELWNEAYFFYKTPDNYDEKFAKKAWKEDTSEIMQLLVEVLNSIEDFSFINIEVKVKEMVAAKELGFIQEKDRSSRPFGTYAGIYNGYNFTIDPDSNATVQLHMNPVPGVEEFSTRQGQTNFDSGDKGFDNFFKTRLVSAELGQKLREAVAFLAYTVEFGKRWKGKYNYIRMYKDSIYCSFKYGSGHYIPASVLEKIIPDLVKLADLLQAAVAEKK